MEMDDRQFEIISFGVEKDNLQEFQKVISRINRFMFGKRPIPYTLIFRLHILIKDLNDLQDDTLDKNINDASNSAEDYFSKKKQYNSYVSVFVNKKESKNSLLPISLDRSYNSKNSVIKDMCSFALSQYYSKDLSKANKGARIRLLYSSIQTYSRKYIIYDEKNNLSHYKITVIASFLANLIGIIKPKIDNNSSPEVFFNKCKDDTQKLIPPKQ